MALTPEQVQALQDRLIDPRRGEVDGVIVEDHSLTQLESFTRFLQSLENSTGGSSGNTGAFGMVRKERAVPPGSV